MLMSISLLISPYSLNLDIYVNIDMYSWRVHTHRILFRIYTHCFTCLFHSHIVIHIIHTLNYSFTFSSHPIVGPTLYLINVSQVFVGTPHQYHHHHHHHHHHHRYHNIFHIWCSIYLGGIITEGTEKGYIEVKPAPYNVVLEDDTYRGEIKIGLKFIAKVNMNFSHWFLGWNINCHEIDITCMMV